MTLEPIDPNEIKIISVYVVCCMNCEKTLHISSEDSNVGEVVSKAASQGWFSYATDDETCSVACPACIKEITENEQESENEAD